MNRQSITTIIILVFGLGLILQMCDSCDESKRLKALAPALAELTANYTGRYSGTFQSEAYVPEANIYPTVININLNIQQWEEVLIDKENSSYVDLSELFDTNADHLEGSYTSYWTDTRTGESMPINGKIYYYPKLGQFCMPGSSRSNGVFGGDICDIVMNPQEILIREDKGRLVRTK